MKAQTYGEALKEATEKLSEVNAKIQALDDELLNKRFDDSLDNTAIVIHCQQILVLKARQRTLEQDIHFYLGKPSDDYLYIPF